MLYKYTNLRLQQFIAWSYLMDSSIVLYIGILLYNFIHLSKRRSWNGVSINPTGHPFCGAILYMALITKLGHFCRKLMSNFSGGHFNMKIIELFKFYVLSVLRTSSQINNDRYSKPAAFSYFTIWHWHLQNMLKKC